MIFNNLLQDVSRLLQFKQKFSFAIFAALPEMKNLAKSSSLHFNLSFKVSGFEAGNEGSRVGKMFEA